MAKATLHYDFEKHHDKGKYYLVVGDHKIARIDKFIGSGGKRKRGPRWRLFPDTQIVSQCPVTFYSRKAAVDWILDHYRHFCKADRGVIWNTGR